MWEVRRLFLALSNFRIKYKAVSFTPNLNGLNKSVLHMGF